MKPTELHHIILKGTLTSFLYIPTLSKGLFPLGRYACRRPLHHRKFSSSPRCCQSEHITSTSTASTQIVNNLIAYDDHLNPPPDSFSTTPFADSCTITVKAGDGGNGCVSFLREKYIEEGPPNGGDGGSGGNVYVQAVPGLTSLHKLSRRGVMYAGKGRNGQGKGLGGRRGDDLLLTVPVGTVVKEISRNDPVRREEEQWEEEEEERERQAKEERKMENERKRRQQQRQQRQPRPKQQDSSMSALEAESEAQSEKNGRSGGGSSARSSHHEDDVAITDATGQSRKRNNWVFFPGELPSAILTGKVPQNPEPRRSSLTAMQPEGPILLDLDKPMENPQLLAAGAMGGRGNSHFVRRNLTRPKVATRGSGGMRLQLKLELKLLADVGLVGLPNAGKSTLLRAISNSKTRIGDWEFTTLQPSIGTVVLDDHHGRPKVQSYRMDEEEEDETGEKRRRRSVRTSITVADIPGIVEGAHMDKGLGLGFLRHIERAAMLAFVVDLPKGDAVTNVQNLWREIGEYERVKEEERFPGRRRRDNDGEKEREKVVKWSPTGFSDPATLFPSRNHGNASDLPELRPGQSTDMSQRPWFVVASKADLTENRDNFANLQAYLDAVSNGSEEHPSGREGAWKKRLYALPLSAIRGEGVDRFTSIAVNLMDL